MELKLIHLYPDLMSLYGSYANVLVLQRALEALGNTVSITALRPGDQADLSQADFLFMGAGTERAQKAALADFARFGSAVKTAAQEGLTMLFCGTAMELLGQSITDAVGKTYAGIGLADFTSTQEARRKVEDVLGHTDIFADPVVGFLNSCTRISGVKTPLLTSLDLGAGNEGPGTPEGFHWNSVFGSALTGPILVKNPRLLDAVVEAIYAHRGEALPTERPRDHWAEDGYAVTVRELQKRIK